MVALMLVVAQGVKVILFVLLVLDLYAHRAVLVEPGGVPQLQELGLAHRRALVLGAAALVVVVEKVQDVFLVMVIVAAAALVAINRVAELLDVDKAHHHSPLAQMVLLAVAVAAVDLVIPAVLPAAALVFYLDKVVAALAVLAVLWQVKAVLAAVTVQELPVVCMVVAVLVLYITPVFKMVAPAHEAQSVLCGPERCVHTHLLA